MKNRGLSPIVLRGLSPIVLRNEMPPRVEYKVTEFGTKFIRILDEFEKLQSEIESEML